MNDYLSDKVFRFPHEAMGTVFELLAAEDDRGYAAQAANAVFAEIDRIERLLSRFDSGSDISRLNRLEPDQELFIAVETYEFLSLCEQMRIATRGAFDVGFNRGRAGNASSFSGKTGSHGTAGADPSENGWKSSIREQRFRFGQSRQGFSVSLNPEVSFAVPVDPGGIGKGFALDKSRVILDDWELKKTLLHAGTSTAAASGDSPLLNRPAKGWPVGISGLWRGAGVPGIFMLCDRALSGSGTEVKGEHIIDPLTGEPARNHLAAWASHPDAAFADALSTAFMVMPTLEIEEFCSRYPDIWALVILPNESFVEFNQAVRTAE